MTDNAQPTMSKQTTANELSAAVIDKQTQHYDFSSGHYDDWITLVHDEKRPHRFDPIMNTLWPLPDGFEVPENAEAKLNNMTIVEVNDSHRHTERFLALTGGGMDMSWHIGQTYVNLGYLPPVTLGRLPRMGGMDFDAPDNRLVIEALKRSNRLMMGRYERNIDRLDDLGE